MQSRTETEVPYCASGTTIAVHRSAFAEDEGLDAAPNASGPASSAAPSVARAAADSAQQEPRSHVAAPLPEQPSSSRAPAQATASSAAASVPAVPDLDASAAASAQNAPGQPHQAEGQNQAADPGPSSTGPGDSSSGEMDEARLQRCGDFVATDEGHAIAVRLWQFAAEDEVLPFACF